MSSPSGGRPREMVYCHQCEDEWYRDEHGLTCPRCHSDFVEVIEQNNDPHDFHNAEDPDEDDIDRFVPLGMGTPGLGMPPQPFEHFGARSPFPTFNNQPANNNGGTTVRQSTYRSPGGGFMMSSVSYSSSGMNNNRSPDSSAQVLNSFGGLLSGILGNLNGGRTPTSPHTQPQSPFGNPQRSQTPFDVQNDIMSQFFAPQNPHSPHGTRSQAGSPPPGMPPGAFQFHTTLNGNANGEVDPHPLFGMMRMLLSGHPLIMNGHGDAAYSQEEFDRIMSQLMEQSQQGGGEPPASADEIAKIPKRIVDQQWLDAHREEQDKEVSCSICMEEANIGTEISELWCGHWYHPLCIEEWVKSHGCCPLCRKTLAESRQEYEAKHGKEKRPRGEKRRSSRQHSHSHRRSSYPPGSYPDDGGSSSSSREGGGESSGGGIRDRISRFLGGGSR